MNSNKDKELIPASASAEKNDAKPSTSPDRNSPAEKKPDIPVASPSMEDVKAHIRANFPDFDVSSLFEKGKDPEEEKKVSFAKGVTPARTPTSYYQSLPPHSYSKGFTPYSYSKAFTPIK